MSSVPFTEIAANEGASFTAVTVSTKVCVAVPPDPSFTTNVTARSEVFGVSEVFR